MWFKIMGTIVNWLLGTILVLWGSCFIFIWARREREFNLINGIKPSTKDEERISVKHYIQKRSLD